MKVVTDYQEYATSPVLDRADFSATEHSRIAQIFVNADMRTWKKGMEKVLATEGIDPEALEPGQYLVFINAAATKMKFYCAGGVIAYLNNGNTRLTYEHLKAIPNAFKGADLEFAEVLRDEIYNILTEPEAESAPAVTRKPVKKVARG